MMPIALYSGSAISGLLFDDFRGALLFAGLILNEFISFGYRLIFSGIYNPQCAIMSTEEDFFVLPSPMTQTYGFFFGFMMGDMYSKGEFMPWRFFVMFMIFILVIYSRVNIGCKNFSTAMFCALIGTLLGVGFYNLVKDYYKPGFYKSTKEDTPMKDFFKLDLSA